MHFYLQSHPIPVKLNQLRRSCQTRTRIAHYRCFFFFFSPQLPAATDYINRPGCPDSKHRLIAGSTRSPRRFSSPPERDAAAPAPSAPLTGGKNFSRCHRGASTASPPAPSGCPGLGRRRTRPCRAGLHGPRRDSKAGDPEEPASAPSRSIGVSRDTRAASEAALPSEVTARGEAQGAPAGNEGVAD